MNRSTKRMTAIGVGVALVAVGVTTVFLGSPASADSAARVDGGDRVVTVYRSPTCGCCEDWEDHMRENGFVIESNETDAMHVVKAEAGVPRPLQSCHTAMVDGYVLEGHVPAEEVVRLLEERPEVTGLAVPGMPVGSPGMEVPGRAADRYEVFAFSGEDAEVWAVR